MSEIRTNIGKNLLYIVVDKTTDPRGFCVANLLVGAEEAKPPYLIAWFEAEDDLPLAQWMLQQHNGEENEKPNDLSEWEKENHIQDFESFNLDEYDIIDYPLEIAEFPDDVDTTRTFLLKEPPKEKLQITIDKL
ncbi:hypothetical protein RN001_002803 [Aquatica leii]|uniref:Uncharacterized protein n=1 Tax=Aquatica leii TaxID=1421715 RepID=A0AAN7SKD3_9COLE|nr:hypothetical protein RN001_002803 [Aquatica leii]